MKTKSKNNKLKANLRKKIGDVIHFIMNDDPAITLSIMLFNFFYCINFRFSHNFGGFQHAKSGTHQTLHWASNYRAHKIYVTRLFLRGISQGHLSINSMPVTGIETGPQHILENWSLFAYDSIMLLYILFN